MLTFESANAGTYILDYTILSDYTIHEAGRFYNSPAGLGFADWAQMTGQTENGPGQVWEYMTGEPSPIIQIQKTNSSWMVRVPAKITGRTGVIELEESTDLKNWSLHTGPIQVGADRQHYYRLKASVAQYPVMSASTAVRVGAATISAGTTAKISGLATVNSLEITASTGAPTPIQITETLKPEAAARVHPLTGLIGIQGLEAVAAAPIEVRVNVSVPKDHFAMGFIFDRATGRFEGMPLKELADDHVTVVSRHFCEFLILEMPIAELPDEVDSGFRPGVDDWEFTNYGSYIAPQGHCAGQAISAMYYYVNQRQKGNAPQLYRLWDNPGNDWATPGIETDNQRGYALASMVQKSIDWDSFANNFWWSLSPGDLNTYRSFVFAMWVTGEPQEVGIYREGGGHAIVAWKCAYGSIHVADPNYPGNDTRWINFNSTSNRFDPYNSGATAAQLGVAYPKILYYGKTTMIDWNLVGKLWEQAKAGTVGAGDYPLITVEIVNEDRSLAGIVTNSMAGGILTIPITGRTFGCGGGDWDKITPYKADGSGCTIDNGWIVTEQETNTIGLDIYKDIVVGTNTIKSWVGFRWLNITRAPIEPVSVSISPPAVTLAAGDSQTFSATVTGTTSITVDRVPRSPLFWDSIHWMAYREADRPCLKAISSTTTITRQFADGTSEVRKSCTMTDVDWTANGGGYVRVYGE